MAIPIRAFCSIGEQNASQRYFGVLSVSDSTVQMPRSLTMLFCSSKTITRGSQTLASFKSNSVKLITSLTWPTQQDDGYPRGMVVASGRGYPVVPGGGALARRHREPRVIPGHM